MKKFYTLLLTSLLPLIAAAQYHPMLDSVSNTWTYVFNMIPVKVTQQTTPNCQYPYFNYSGASTLSTIGDTSMNGMNYQIVLYHSYNSSSPDCIYGYIREDSVAQKVYFIDNIINPEMVIYDFSLTVGSTIQLNFLAQNGYYQDGTFTLDSIGVINIPAGPRRIFYFNNHISPSIYPLEWIESVGHPGDLVYTLSENNYGGFFALSCLDNIDRYFYQMLTCFEHSNQKVYFDSCAHANAVNNFCVFYGDSCDYWNICGSVVENSILSSLELSPNPVKDQTSAIFKATRDDKMNIIIRTLEGRIIRTIPDQHVNTGENKIPISTKGIAAGAYLIEFRLKEGTVTRKIIIN